MSIFPRAPVLAAVIALSVVPAALCAGPSTRTIVVDNLEFGPAPHDLRVGDTVEWRNRDLFRHSATANDDSFDVDLPPGGSGKITLKRSGEIGYYCRYHPGMKGSLIVAPQRGGAPTSRRKVGYGAQAPPVQRNIHLR